MPRCPHGHPKNGHIFFSVSGVFSSNQGLKETKKHKELERGSSAFRWMPQLLVSSLISKSTKLMPVATPHSAKSAKTVQNNAKPREKSSPRGKFKTSHTLLATKTTNTLVRSRECMGAGKTDYGVQYLPHKLVNLSRSPGSR